MRIKNQATVALSIILISIGTVSSVNAQLQIENLTVNRQNKELEKIQEEEDIRDIVQEEVDRIIGITFENTINLINLNIAILSGLAALVALFFVLMPIIAWLIRTSLKTYIEKELDESLQKEIEEYKNTIIANKNEIGRLTTENTNRILEAETMVNSFENQIKNFEIQIASFESQMSESESKLAEASEKVNKIKQDTELREQLQQSIVENATKTVNDLSSEFESKMKDFENKLNDLSLEFETKLISTAENKKDEIVQEISELTSPLTSIRDTNQPDIQQKIQQLTKQLEELKNKNPQLFFTTDDYLKQGDAFFYEERYEDAIIAYNKVIERKRHSYIAWVNRGWALRRLERYEEALSSYNEAILIKSDDYIAWYGKANVFRELQKYEEAIITYNKSLKLNDKFEWSWYRKALCYLLNGDKDKALDDLQKAIELNPELIRKSAINDEEWDVIRESEEFKQLFDE